MWRPRDHERFIGGYDPEHEMPDPDRGPRERYQSDAYRYNSRDTRYGYRWNPDRFEDRFRDRDDRREWELRWNRDARDRDYGRDYGRDDYDGRYDYNRGYDRYDFDRGWSDRNRGGYYEGDFDRSRDFDGPRDFDRPHDSDRAREFGGRGYERDWRDRARWGSSGNDRDNDDRWRNRGGRW